MTGAWSQPSALSSASSTLLDTLDTLDILDTNDTLDTLDTRDTRDTRRLRRVKQLVLVVYHTGVSASTLLHPLQRLSRQRLGICYSFDSYPILSPHPQASSNFRTPSSRSYAFSTRGMCLHLLGSVPAV